MRRALEIGPGSRCTLPARRRGLTPASAYDEKRNIMRIAFTITELDVGGAERCFTNLAVGLDRRRFEPSVYCLAPPPRDDQLVRQLQEAGVPVYFLGAKHAWQLPAIRKRLERLLAQQQPLIVQSFLFHADVVSALAARAIPQARILFGVRVEDPSWWRRRVELALMRRVHGVVCVSNQIAAGLRASHIPDEALTVIPNGIDLDRFDAASGQDAGVLSRESGARSSGADTNPSDYRLPATDYRLPATGYRHTASAHSSAATEPPSDHLTDLQGRRVMLFVGRLHPQKGLDWFLRQCPGLFRTLPDHDLVIVGDGPQRRSLESLAASLGIAGRVHFLGRRDDVAQLMRRSEMLVLPSRWEGMPNVVLEAMAARLPVVCSRVSGASELLGENFEPQSFAFGNAVAVLERIARLAGDTDLRTVLGGENRRRAESQFSLRVMICRYAALYESLV
jgi:glycosyltransferase involved in cell wall biosynthesis